MTAARLRRGIYPGSFHPLTVAHVAIIDAALEQRRLDRLDLAISQAAFDKAHLSEQVEQRVDALRRFADGRGDIDVVVSEHRLIADLAAGYDAVVMGADKWHQLHELRFYDGDRAAQQAGLPQQMSPGDFQSTLGQLTYLGSFTDGATTAFLVGAIMMLVASLIIWIFLDVKHEELATDGPEGVHAG